MALTAEEFKELALLARESGDEALEMQALEGFNNVKSEVGNFDLESVDPAGPIATNLPPPSPSQTSIGGGRSGLSRRKTQQATRTSELLKGVESGQISSKDLTPIEVSRVQRAKIDAIPELSIGNFRKLSGDVSLMSSLAAMTTFDPDEFGRIISKSDPNIGIVTTPDGERIAFNNKTNEALSINKVGPSMMDAAQLGIATAALAPAAAFSGIAAPALAAGAIQANIETGQAAAGGEFNALPVAGATLAGPIIRGGMKGAQSVIQGLRSSLGISQPAARAAVQEAVPAAQALDDAAPPRPLALDPIEDVAPRRFHPLLGQESRKATEIRTAIESGSDDIAAAGYMINGANRVVSNPIAKEVMSQGKRTSTFEPGKTTLFAGSSRNDKTAFGKMLDIVESGLRSATFAAKNRPGQVVGDTVLERWKAVKNINKTAGKEVKIARNNLDGNRVNLNDVEAKFLDDIDELGISVGDDLKLNYFDSRIEGSEGAEAILNKIWPRLQRLKENPDARKAHNLKGFIDSLVETGKKSTDKPLTRDAENVANNLRFNVNEMLRKQFPEYKAANVKYSETIEKLQDFAKSTGKHFNPKSPLSNEFVGKKTRTLLSNNITRETFSDAITGLESVAKKYGANFSDDINTQILMVEELEKSFGTFAPTGLQGEVGKAVTQAMKGGKIISPDTAIRVAKQLKINEKNMLKALRKLAEQQ